jgi:hypothetical protein
MRHRVPVHIFRADSAREDPLERAGRVAAFVNAAANWAPNAEAARASAGRSQAV